MSENLDVEIPWPGWRVVSRLGHGTYGSVWEIERDVAGDSERGALKVIGVPPEGEADDSLGLGYDEGTLSATYDERADAVLREYRLMAGLSSHPNVVSCRDFAKIARVGEPGYDVLIRMELLTPLTRWVRGKEIAVRDAARIGRDVARALSACESRGIVHRDVKPENIMVDEWGNFKLGDFGVARTLEGTRTATTAGTETYMAPEVIRHDRYNQTVDIYSLGLVMWWLLNDYRLPFMPAGRLASGDVARAEARRLAGESIPAPAGCPDAFARIVLRACAFRPEDRYQSAAEMVTDLEAFLAGGVPSGATVTPRAEVDVAVQQSSPNADTPNDTDWGETTDATVGKRFGVNSAIHANSFHDEPATVGRTPTSVQSPHATVTPTTRRIPKPVEVTSFTASAKKNLVNVLSRAAVQKGEKIVIQKGEEIVTSPVAGTVVSVSDFSIGKLKIAIETDAIVSGNDLMVVAPVRGKVAYEGWSYSNERLDGVTILTNDGIDVNVSWNLLDEYRDFKANDNDAVYPLYTTDKEVVVGGPLLLIDTDQVGHSNTLWVCVAVHHAPASLRPTVSVGTRVKTGDAIISTQESISARSSKAAVSTLKEESKPSQNPKDGKKCVGDLLFVMLFPCLIGPGIGFESGGSVGAVIGFGIGVAIAVLAWRDVI